MGANASLPSSAAFRMDGMHVGHSITENTSAILSTKICYLRVYHCPHSSQPTLSAHHVVFWLADSQLYSFKVKDISVMGKKQDLSLSIGAEKNNLQMSSLN